MDISIVIITIISVAIVIGAIVSFLHKKPSFNTIVEKIKELCYQLFLEAEKKDLVNEEKMEWCVKQLINRLPDLKLDIDEDTVRVITQYVYDLYKKSAEKYLKD